jgi:hypothetical protein
MENTTTDLSNEGPNQIPERPYLAIVSDASGRVLATRLSPHRLNEQELDRLRVSALLRADQVPTVITDSAPISVSKPVRDFLMALGVEFRGDIAA